MSRSDRLEVLGAALVLGGIGAFILGVDSQRMWLVALAPLMAAGAVACHVWMRNK